MNENTKTLESRLKPLMQVLSDLETVDFNSEEELQEAKVLMSKSDMFSIPKLERLLSLAVQAKEEIFRTDIPALLSELGLSEAKMEDGTTVSKETVYTVKQLDKAKVASWLIDNGYGSSIKDNLAFERGQYTDAIDEFLRGSGASFSRSQDVHAQTLKKVVKEHLESGLQEPPHDAIDVSIFERGVVKAPKKKGF